MTVSERCEVVPTWDMTNEQWLDARMGGIGGSEIGAIAGLSKYESPYSIWARKVHHVNTFDGNEATDLGHALELPVAQVYAKEKNAAIVEWKVILRSKEHQFLSANVDFFIVEPSDQFPAGVVTQWCSVEEPAGIQAILECKTGALASPGAPQDWFRGGTESAPDGYTCQVLWYCGATGLPRAELACLLGGYGMQYRTVEFDQGIFDNLLSIGEAFWNDYVMTGWAPEIDGSTATEESIKHLYPVSTPGSIVDGGQELADLWTEFQSAKAETKSAQEVERKLRTRIVAIIGDAELAMAGDTPICTYKTTKDSTFFADELLKKDDPDTYDRYVRTKPGYRVLREKK